MRDRQEACPPDRSRDPTTEPVPDTAGWVFWLPALVVLASWFDWAPRGLGLTGRPGLYWATGIFLVGAGIAVARGYLRPARALRTDRTLRAPAILSIAVVGFWALAATRAADRRSALLETARVGVSFLFLAFTWAVSARDDRPRRILGLAATALIGVQVLVFIAGLIDSRVRAIVFEQTAGHSLAPGVPRFRGLLEHPMECGSASLLLVGLCRGLGRRGVNRAVTAAGAAIVATTLSFATLVLPVVAAFCLLARRPRARAVAVGVAAGVALAVLWVNPLRLDVAGRTLFERDPIRNYFKDNLGPQHMPRHSVVLPGVRVDFHLTGYAILAARGVTCALEHPLGVGGRNFVRACPVWAMNTFGGWTSRRSAHNAYGALLSEGGLGTTLVTLAFLLVVSRRARRRSNADVEVGVVLAYLLAGFGGASPFQFGFVALTVISVCDKRTRTV